MLTTATIKILIIATDTLDQCSDPLRCLLLYEYCNRYGCNVNLTSLSGNIWHYSDCGLASKNFARDICTTPVCWSTYSVFGVK